jgi:hypothetical protein
MLNEKFFIFLFLAVDLTLSVKPTDFCILKQEECKGCINDACDGSKQQSKQRSKQQHKLSANLIKNELDQWN